MPMTAALEQHFNDAAMLFTKSPAAGFKKLMEPKDAGYAARRREFLFDQLSNPHLARGIIYVCAHYREKDHDASTGYLLAMAYDAIGLKKEALIGYRKAADHGFKDAKKSAEKIDFSHLVEILIPKMLKSEDVARHIGGSEEKGRQLETEWRQVLGEQFNPPRSIMDRLMGRALLPESLRQLRLTERYDDLFIEDFCIMPPMPPVPVVQLASASVSPAIEEEKKPVIRTAFADRVRSPYSFSQGNSPEKIIDGEEAPPMPPTRSQSAKDIASRPVPRSYAEAAAAKPASVIQDHFR